VTIPGRPNVILSVIFVAGSRTFIPTERISPVSFKKARRSPPTPSEEVMRTATNRKSKISIVGRASIGLASAAIAVTTLGAASASAATVRQSPVNATTISQLPSHSPTLGSHYQALQPEAFPAGGKGSGSATTCNHFTQTINKAYNNAKWSWEMGATAAANSSLAEADAQVNAALDAGCAVANPPA
jgi:hypothetical protein